MSRRTIKRCTLCGRVHDDDACPECGYMGYVAVNPEPYHRDNSRGSLFASFDDFDDEDEGREFGVVDRLNTDENENQTEDEDK